MYTQFGGLTLRMLAYPDVQSLMVLAAESIIGGNFLIFGVAGNTISVLFKIEFAHVVIPLGFFNLLVYWVWFC